MRKQTTDRPMMVGVLILSAVLASACGGGDPAAQGPRAGSAEWHWDGAVENLNSADFSKAVEHLDEVASQEGPLAEKAVLWRTSTLVGLSRGYMEVIDALSDGVSENDARAADYQNLMQQANRSGRQAAIALAESLGEVQKAAAGDSVMLDFPFPSGSGSESNVMTAVASGDAVQAAQLSSAVEHTLRRGMIRAASELGGFDIDASNQAAAKFEAGAVSVAGDQFRQTMAKVLLDVSLMFSRERVNEPDVRKILIERAEQWAAPYAESEDEEAKAWAEEFAKEVEDEQRDMERKARRLDKRS